MNVNPFDRSVGICVHVFASPRFTNTVLSREGYTLQSVFLSQGILVGESIINRLLGRPSPHGSEHDGSLVTEHLIDRSIEAVTEELTGNYKLESYKFLPNRQRALPDEAEMVISCSTSSHV